MICRFLLLSILLSILILLLYIIGIEKYKKISLEHELKRYIKYNEKYFLPNNNIILSQLNYVRLIKRKEFQTLTDFENVENPNISFISAVYNKEKYLDLLIISIQRLNITDIEIIFVDDCSEDKSIKIITIINIF